MMAAITATLVGSGIPSLDQEKASTTAVVAEAPVKFNSINDFVVYQGQTLPDTPLIAYPGSELGAADFVDYTAKELDQFADEAAKELASQGLTPTVRNY